MEKDEDEEVNEKDQKRGFIYYFNKLDHEILRPILIYKYNPESLERQEQYVELMQNDKDAMFKVYGALQESKQSVLGTSKMTVTDRVTQAVVALSKDVKQRNTALVLNAQKEEINLQRLSGNFSGMKSSVFV